MSRGVAKLSITIAMLALALPGQVLAYDPTLGVDKYGQDVNETFDWSTGATGSAKAWLRSAFTTAAEDDWDPKSRAPTFAHNSSSSNLVRFQDRDLSDCNAAIAWYACTLYDPPNANGLWWQTIYADEETWCHETGFVNGCLDVRRVALHELGHAVGLSRKADNGGIDAHSTEPESVTVMRLSTPRRAGTGWDRHAIQECDAIELQREYDLAQTANPADCIESFGGLTGGDLTSVAYQGAPSATVACTSVQLSGTLKLIDHADYGRFGNNNLDRTVDLQRRPSGGSTWTTIATFNTPSGDWTRSVTMSSGTWDFRLVFGGSTRVAPDNSGTRTVTWYSPC